MPSVVATVSAPSSQMSWTCGETDFRAEERLGDEVLRQPLHQEQRHAAEHGHGREQDLVGPAAGEDLRGMGHEQGDDVDRARPCASYSLNRPSTRGSERDAADDERHADQAEQPEFEPARSGPDRSERAGERRQPDAPALRAGGHRSASFEAHPDLADLQLVTEAERRDALDPTPVDVRAVRAAEVLDVPGPPAVGQHGVVGRRERVVDDDRVVDVPTERGDDIEAVATVRRRARRPATRG